MPSRRMYTENEIKNLAGGGGSAQDQLDQLTRWTKATADSPTTILDRTNQTVWTKHPIIIPFLNQPAFTIYEDLADHLGWEMTFKSYVFEIDGQYYTEIAAYFGDQESTIEVCPCWWNASDEVFYYDRDIRVQLYTPEDKWLKEKYRHWKFIAFGRGDDGRNPFACSEEWVAEFEPWWTTIVETPVDYDNPTYVYIADKMKYNIGKKSGRTLSLNAGEQTDHQLFPFCHQNIEIHNNTKTLNLDLKDANYNIFDIDCPQTFDEGALVKLIAGRRGGNVFGELPEGTLTNNDRDWDCPTFEIRIPPSTETPTIPTVRVIVKNGVIDVHLIDFKIQ